jgi:hypothetical protein
MWLLSVEIGMVCLVNLVSINMMVPTLFPPIKETVGLPKK